MRSSERISNEMERVLRHSLFTASRVRFWALKFFLIDEKIDLLT